MNNIFYVYVYCNEKYLYKIKNNWNINFLPFYVGKGKNSRDISHLSAKKSHNIPFKKYLKKLDEENNSPMIKKVYENLNEKEAYKLENELINFFDVIYSNAGTLFNKYINGKIYEIYDMKMIDKIVNEYENVVCSEINGNICINENYKTKIPKFIVAKIMSYIKIGFTINECCEYFKIEKQILLSNIDEDFLKKWTI